jgi:hypothetical protein
MKHRKVQKAPPVVAQASPPVQTPPAPVPDPALQPPAGTPAPVDAAVTNQNVLDMVEAKVPETTIVSQIRSSKTNFDLSTAGVIQLTKGGVKANIIEVMRNPKTDTAAAQRAGQQHPPTPPVAPATKSAPGQSMPAPFEPVPAPVAAPIIPHGIDPRRHAVQHHVGSGRALKAHRRSED